MANEEVDQQLWAHAEENVTKQQEEAFDALFDKAVEEHLANDECDQCEDGISDRCDEWLRERIENWQEERFQEEMESEYDRLMELREEQDEE